MTISSNRVIAPLTLFALLFSGVASAATTLKIATITPEGSQWMTEMRAGAAQIKERTEGRVEVKYFGGTNPVCLAI